MRAFLTGLALSLSIVDAATAATLPDGPYDTTLAAAAPASAVRLAEVDFMIEPLDLMPWTKLCADRLRNPAADMRRAWGGTSQATMAERRFDKCPRLVP